MNSSFLKINRATKHIKELVELFRDNSPFTYFLETNVKTGQRATFAKRNESVANDAAIIIGDVIHNLRASIDHAYWDATNAHAKSEEEKRSIQFPIASTEKALKESVIPGLPSRVSESFAQALIKLKPYREHGGNQALCAIHDLDIIDKHRLLIPTGNYTKITSEIIQREVPDFPGGLKDCEAGNCRRDVAWYIIPMNRKQRRARKIPKSGILEQKLNVPVEIVFSADGFANFKPVISTLNNLAEIARTTIEAIYNA